jgi:hypothetical protein
MLVHRFEVFNLRAAGDQGPEWHFCSPVPDTETARYLRNAAVPRRFEGPSHVAQWRPDWLAGVRGLELTNVGLIECRPNPLVCRNIFVPETFGEEPQKDGRGSRWGSDQLYR